MANFMFDRVEAASEVETFPIRLVQETSAGAIAAKVLLISPALAGLAVPLLLAAGATAAPSPLALLTERPFAALQVTLGMALWGGLFVWPLKRILRHLGLRRRVEITPAEVTVTDRTFFASESWTAPLPSFQGIAHHVRTSLSGVRHELVLVHPDPRRNVLLAIADHMPASRIERCKALLGMPEIPARQLYAAATLRAQPALG